MLCSAEASSTQGMGIDDLFSREGGTLRPVLTALQVPVRAVVMPLTNERASRWVGSWAGEAGKQNESGCIAGCSTVGASRGQSSLDLRLTKCTVSNLGSRTSIQLSNLPCPQGTGSCGGKAPCAAGACRRPMAPRLGPLPLHNLPCLHSPGAGRQALAALGPDVATCMHASRSFTSCRPPPLTIKRVRSPPGDMVTQGAMAGQPLLGLQAAELTHSFYNVPMSEPSDCAGACGCQRR